MGSQFRDRDYAPFSIVHFTVRGFNKRRIFLDEFDQEDYLATLRFRLDATAAEIRPKLLTYAQMPNHQHVLVKHSSDPLAMCRIIHSVCTRYAMAFNQRYGRGGKVFEKSFRGRVVTGGDHLANTFAYIHLNPDASLRTHNSGHGFYAGLHDDPHIDPSIAWRLFGGRDGYLRYFDDTARLRAARAAAKRSLNPA